ncbi:MAG: Cell division inhibitor [Chthoniobacteraceae bacterium]|nr:Cell division inhibitor [Chthoniobacteraceae bacterium]
MNVLITGATGFIGRALVAHLQAHGHQCTVFSRDPLHAAACDFPAGVRFAEVGIPAGIDAVIHLAGENVAGLWTAGKRRAIMASRVEGTRRIVRAMADAEKRPRIFLCASAVGIYGNRPGEELDESSPTDGQGSFRSKVCVAWEAAADEARGLGMRVVKLRIGNVVDPDDGYFARLGKIFRAGLPFVFGNGASMIPWVSMEDCVRLIAFALETERFNGPFNVVAPNPLSHRAFAVTLATHFGRRLRGAIPAWLLRGVLGEFSCTLLDDQRVVPRSAMAAGFVFRHPAWRAWVDARLR